MEKLTTWFKETWAKIKEFMLRQWQGLPMYVWVVIFLLVLIVLLWLFVFNKPKNSTKW